MYHEVAEDQLGRRREVSGLKSTGAAMWSSSDQRSYEHTDCGKEK